jgi:hypothetical protein
MSLKEKIAAVLNLLADEHDARPETVERAEEAKDVISKFAETYRGATGEEMTPELRERIQADDVLRDALAKMASAASNRPTPLGEAADSATGEDDSRSKSKEAAERQAYDRFAQGILAIGQR